MIAIIVPAHDEEACIGACLQATAVAGRCPLLAAETVLTVVVLDACRDGTAAVALRMGVRIARLEARNVGAARALGADIAIQAGARWLAFTDADTCVSPGWLSAQLALRADAVCGTVAVQDWGSYGDNMRLHYAATYKDADDHRHIHGANLGVSTAAYRRAGGFSPLCSSEDVALVRALESSGALIAWSARPRVHTSARRTFRAPAGFGATLLRVEAEAAQVQRSMSP